MGRRKEFRHHTDGLTALILFGVFAVCILSVLLAGAEAYRRLTERDREAYAERTCAQYLAMRVRQAPSGGAVTVSEADGTDVLGITEEIGGERYVTRVFCHDGWIRELFSAENAEFSPADGEKVMEAEALKLGLSDGLLTAEITDTGGEKTLLKLSLRGEGAFR